MHAGILSCFTPGGGQEADAPLQMLSAAQSVLGAHCLLSSAGVKRHSDVQQGNSSGFCGLQSLVGATVQLVVQHGSVSQRVPQSQISPFSTMPLPQYEAESSKQRLERASSTRLMVVELQLEKRSLFGWREGEGGRACV